MISSIVTPARPLLLNKWRALLRMRSRVSGFWLGGCGTGNTSPLWLDPRGCPPDVLEHLMRPAKLRPVLPFRWQEHVMGNTFPRLPKLKINRRQMMFGTGVSVTTATLASIFPDIALAQPAEGSAMKYSDGIAASRTMIAIAGNAAALQRRLPSGWELAPFAGTDLQGTMLTGANMLVPFHEVYAIRDQGRTSGLDRKSVV